MLESWPFLPTPFHYASPQADPESHSHYNSKGFLPALLVFTSLSLPMLWYYPCFPSPGHEQSASLSLCSELF